MKFISKSANLNIILRPGLPAQPITGTPPVPTLFVKFVDGLANVEDEKLIEMMKNHSGFNRDFVAADETGADPYAYLRESSDVQHVHTEMKYGHPVARNVSPVKKQLPPEIKKMIQDQAMEIAKQLLPSMVEATLKEMVSSSSLDKTTEQNVDNSGESTTEGIAQVEVSSDNTGDHVFTGAVTQPLKPVERKRPGRPRKNVVSQ